MADRNLVLQLLITARDDASAAFGKLANLIREKFANLFGGGLSGAAEFEAQLDKVAAKGGYTATEMKGLTEEARKVAAQFGVTGTEAAQGLEILAAAGLNAREAIATLPVVLALAKSEGISLDSAATKLSDSLSIMGLGFDQAGRMADVLAKGANLSTTSAAELADALSNAGGLAKAFGLNLEQTVAVLDLLAKNGIKGAAAGTALAAILTQLQNPASTASKALDGLGITTRDLGGVLDALKAQGASSETAIIAFGETAGPGLRALLNEGSAGINSFTAQLNDANGAAQQAADAMGGNLKSALSSLSAAWETVKQTLAEPLLEPLAKAAKALSDALTGAVQGGAFSGLTDAIKTLAKSAGDAATVFIKAFDFKAIGDNVNGFVTGAVNVFSQAMNNLQAIAGGLVAAALIPMGLQIRTMAVETYALVTAKLALARAMTAAEIAAAGFSRVMAVLMGPAGWVLAGVAALTLLWKEQDKTKAATDALAGSTEDYTQKLKEQTETANKLALLKLDEGLAALQDGLAKTAAAYDRMNGKIGETVIVYDEVSGVAKLVAVTEQTLLEKRLALEKATAAVAEAEKRRALIVEELRAKQEAANPATVAAEAALGKYRKAVEEATAEQEKAKASLAALTPGTTDYGIAAGKAAAADERLKQAKEVLTRAESDYNAEIQRTLRELPQAAAAADDHAKEIGQGVKGLEQGVVAAKKYADVIADVVDAETAGIRAEIALAQAKGDTAKAQELSQRLALAEADGAARVARAKEAEQVAEYAVAVAKRNQVEALIAKNQATQMDLALAELTVQKELAEAIAAGTNTQAQEALAQALRNVNAAKAGAIDEIQQHTQATEENSQAQQQNIKHTKDTGQAAAGVAAYLQQAREEVDRLSEATRALFEVELAVALKRLAFEGGARAALNATVAFNAGVDASSKTLAHYATELNNANELIDQSKEKLLFASNGFRKWEAAIELATGKAKKGFYEQAIAAEQLRVEVERLGKQGADHVGMLALATRALNEDFGLLDEQTLSGLRGEIERTTAKLREMQDEAAEAQRRLQELDAEIAAESGDTARADRLKLELDRTDQLAEAEKRLQEAKAAGNADAVRAYDEQIRKLQELYDLKQRNLDAEQRQQDAQRNAPPPDYGPPRRSDAFGNERGGVNQTFNINVDGSDLLSETQIRNKVLPVLQRATRLNA